MRRQSIIHEKGVLVEIHFYNGFVERKVTVWQRLKLRKSK